MLGISQTNSLTNTHARQTPGEGILLLLTGGDIKHIFLLQFYTIESRKVPIFPVSKPQKKERTPKPSTRTEKSEIEKDAKWERATDRK
jgi:hypothetical protein